MSSTSAMHELQGILVQWKREAVSPDIFGNSRHWVKGVVFGLDLAVKVVKKHTEKRGKRV